MATFFVFKKAARMVGSILLQRIYDTKENMGDSGPIPKTVSIPTFNAKLNVVARMSDIGMNSPDVETIDAADEWSLEIRRNAVVNSEPCVVKIIGKRAPKQMLRTIAFECDIFERLLNISTRLASFFPHPIARIDCEHHVGIAVERFESFTALSDVVGQMTQLESSALRKDAEDTIMILLLQWCFAVLTLRAVGVGHTGNPLDAVVVPFEGVPSLKQSTFAVTRVSPSDGSVLQCAVYRFPMRYRVLICAFDMDAPRDTTTDFKGVPIKRLKHIQNASTQPSIQDILFDPGTPWRKWSLPYYSGDAADVIVIPVF